MEAFGAQRMQELQIPIRSGLATTIRVNGVTVRMDEIAAACSIRNKFCRRIFVLTVISFGVIAHHVFMGRL